MPRAKKTPSKEESMEVDAPNDALPSSDPALKKNAPLGEKSKAESESEDPPRKETKKKKRKKKKAAGENSAEVAESDGSVEASVKRRSSSRNRSPSRGRDENGGQCPIEREGREVPTRTIIKREQMLKKNAKIVLKVNKAANNKDDVIEGDEEEEYDLLSDDGFESTQINPYEDYSDKHYDRLKREFMERMGQEAAELLIVLERKMHERKLSLDKRLKVVVLGGRFEIEVWYDGAYPEEYSRHEKLFVCDGCFKFYINLELWQRHAKDCHLVYSPPGVEVYRDRNTKFSVFKVHAGQHNEYCQRFSLFVMLFLSTKCVYLEMDSFDFFIVCEWSDKSGFRPMGYFSRQRLSELANNLACFCVFPCYQQRGLGKFIIDFSYKLSILSKMPATPERPFSSFGLITYISYWKRCVVRGLWEMLQERDDDEEENEDESPIDNSEIPMENLVMTLGMREEDIKEVIEALFPDAKIGSNLNIDKKVLEKLYEKEVEKDKTKIYAELENFDSNFLEYMRDFKAIMMKEEEREKKRLEKEKEKKKMMEKEQKRQEKEKEEKKKEMEKREGEGDGLIDDQLVSTVEEEETEKENLSLDESDDEQPGPSRP